MSMTLEEAIEHAEKVAEENEKEFGLCPYPSQECNGTQDCRCLENGEGKGCLKCAAEHRQLAEWLKELQERRKQTEIIYCGECVYYDPPHVENNGVRYEYSEMPKEAFDVLGTGLVSVEYGINVGGRCCVDYYCKNYPDDKRVYVPKDNYCGRAERRTDG